MDETIAPTKISPIKYESAMTSFLFLGCFALGILSTTSSKIAPSQHALEQKPFPIKKGSTILAIINCINAAVITPPKKPKTI
jgi:hypothetical protein